MPRYVTDKALEEIPALREQEPDQRAQTLADADAVYAFVRRNEWITEDDLRVWSEGQSMSPDRLNVALELLAQTARLNIIADPTTATGETAE